MRSAVILGVPVQVRRPFVGTYSIHFQCSKEEQDAAGDKQCMKMWEHMPAKHRQTSTEPPSR
jgi:hypothetical protein